MRKIIWFTVSVLMTLSLVVASCGPADVEEEEEEEEEEAVSGTGEPQYGGVYNIWHGASDPAGFDPYQIMDLLCSTLFIANDELITGDWTKGPAGTGETDWLLGHVSRIDVLAGSLAESWEVKDDETIIYNIRKGVRWWDKEPANGREFTAEDAAWNLTQMWEFPQSTHYSGTPKEQHLISATALDKYTLETKVPAGTIGLHIIMDGERCHMVCKDVVDKYGDMKDWHHASGTGPFMLTDYIPGSSITYERNPNYWAKDPVGPGKGNQLPYLDGIKALIIADMSTRMAAFRTGKIDLYQGMPWEDAELFFKSNPELEYAQTYTYPYFPTGRQDKEELPFKDLVVRQAMNLAVNQQEILDDYYEGHAELLGWPYYPCAAHQYLYVPLKDMTEIISADEGSQCSGAELYTYNPEKAKQLLAEAGYPNGFKTKIECLYDHVDLLSIIREYLLEVDIDIEITPMEAGVFRSVNRGRKHEEMIMKEPKMHAHTFRMHELRSESFDNLSFYEHPRTRELYNEMNKLLGYDDMAWMALVKAEVPFMVEQCVMGVWLPVPYAYHMWWPWVKNFRGETDIGFFTPNKAATYLWIDAKLKESMGY